MAVFVGLSARVTQPLRVLTSRAQISSRTVCKASSEKMKPTLYYFPIRGRGEPIRLCLAALEIEMDEAPVDREQMKNDLSLYPFGQCPRFADEDVDMVQSNAIVRHLGRKHGLAGATLAEQAVIDMLLDGVEAIKGKYLGMIYGSVPFDEAKAAYWAAHCDAASVATRNGGAHFVYLSELVKRSSGGKVFAVGGKLSIADIMIFDIVDMHVRIYGDQFTAAFPELAALHAAVAAVPGVAAYLSSDRRSTKQNGNTLG